MAGRPPGATGIRLTEEHRLKIQKSNVLKYLILHVEGKREMGASQVTAALGLLKKALPDLSSITLSGDDENPIRVSIDAERFTRAIAGLAARNGTPEGS